MSIDFDELNPCRQFNKSIEDKMKKWRRIGQKKGSIEAVFDKMKKSASGLDNKVDNIAIGSENIVKNVSESVDSLIGNAKGLTGDCADSALSKLTEIMGDSKGFMNSILDSLSDIDLANMIGEVEGLVGDALQTVTKPLNDLMSKMMSIESITEAMGIKPLLQSIDKLLDCLGSSECFDIIDPDVLDGYFKEINDLLDDLALNDNGVLDIDKVMANSGLSDKLNLTETLKTGMKSFTEYTDGLSDSLKSTLSDINKAKNSIKLPKNFL